MNQEISKELIEKYLAGDLLQKEELARIEDALKQESGNLRQQMTAMIPETPWNGLLLDGIRYTGEKQLKKKLLKVSDSLTEDGFYLDEEDIEAWYKKELSGDQLVIFNKRLAKDPQFAQKVTNEQQLLSGIQQYGERGMKSKIENARKELEAEGFFETTEKQQQSEAKIVPLASRRVWLAIAAAAVLLIAAAIWFFSPKPVDQEQLFAQNFETYPDKISESLRSELNVPGYAGSPEAEKWNTFLAAMEAYPKAIPALESFLQKYPDERIARFYLAQAQLANGQEAPAKTNFEMLEKDTGFEEAWAVKWHLALINLKENNLSRTKELLEELKQSSSEYREKAAKLLDELP